ncbi:hypothetical protein [Candidatus Enterococcus clewellii]|uniref:Uncharacterized protein n=1 Tax=Candidatus Enterococcus clewellii TaxID=1834193 RepID=A0A242K8S1_9ENTE|nr:hypothetical protein [Enterococcus sp. 9E7_DIV0242]OTP17563.1 hypothetical protein A5888_001701 [Enterococcus sp. 9E7_DIV0242]
MAKIMYEVKLYTDNMPLYHNNLRYCGRFSGGETFKKLSEAEEYARNIVKKYKWLSGGYAHIVKTTYLGFIEGYKNEHVKEIEYKGE